MAGNGVRKAEKGAGSSAAAILAAAKKLFLEEGYIDVRIEQIAEAADVSRQTIYNHFRTKETILRAVIESHWANIRSEVVMATLAKSGPATDPADALRHFAQSIFRFITETEQAAFTRLVISESGRLPWIAEEFYRLGKLPVVIAFTRCLEELTERGLLHCPDPELAAHQFMGLIQEFLVWPKVMAIGVGEQRIPPKDIVIDEAILTFLARYRSPRAT